NDKMDTTHREYDADPIAPVVITGTKTDSMVLSTLNLQPNPAHGQITLSFRASRNNRGIIHIFDLNGVELIKEEISVDSGKNEMAINIHGLKSGSYILRLEQGGGSAEAKFVVQ